tara:strand:+ start:64546 stop:64758 length:213 start_codon:yes stop_codon:yes gene_type:complete
MNINVGAADRVIRFVLGTGLILAPVSDVFGIALSLPAAVVCVLIGIVLVATAFLRFCPLYRALGASTCRR